MDAKKGPGFCVECSATAVSEAMFKVTGVILIRKYCSKCLAKAEYEVD